MAARLRPDPLDGRDGVQISIERGDEPDTRALGRRHEVRVVEREALGLEQLDRSMQEERIAHGDRWKGKERTSRKRDLIARAPVVGGQHVHELGEDHVREEEDVTSRQERRGPPSLGRRIARQVPNEDVRVYEGFERSTTS